MLPGAGLDQREHREEHERRGEGDPPEDQRGHELAAAEQHDQAGEHGDDEGEPHQLQRQAAVPATGARGLRLAHGRPRSPRSDTAAIPRYTATTAPHAPSSPTTNTASGGRTESSSPTTTVRPPTTMASRDQGPASSRRRPDSTSRTPSTSDPAVTSRTRVPRPA